VHRPRFFSGAHADGNVVVLQPRSVVDRAKGCVGFIENCFILRNHHWALHVFSNGIRAFVAAA
jgi:hypothetical protein